MADRTMVKARCIADGIEFKTFGQAKGMSNGFFVFRNTFEDLERYGYTIQHALESYGVFQMDRLNGIVSIRFAWLNRSGDRLSGWEETIELDYEALMAFVKASAETDDPKEWRYLTIPSRRKLPQLVFRCPERLQACLSNKLVRRKLVKFLRDNFKWPRTDRIEFYADFVPYSFFFQEYCGGKPAICGGVILHGQEDMAKAYYSIHT